MSSNPKKNPAGAKSQVKKIQSKKSNLPFSKENYIIFFTGLLTIIIGYICMASGDLNGALSLTVSPILLSIGYLIIIPLAILYRKKESVAPSQN
jgi:hypothetical protein